MGYNLGTTTDETEAERTTEVDLKVLVPWDKSFIEAFKQIQIRAHQNSRSKGFWKAVEGLEHLFSADGNETALREITGMVNAQKIALMHSELSEALEGDRKDASDDKLPNRSMLEVELADCIIRIMDLAEKRGLDVARAIIEKMVYNSTRPYKHGKEY